MGLFREGTETAMDNGYFWLAEKHFRFIERIWNDADQNVANAIEVCYLEDLALGQWTRVSIS